jgi:hypothetical protein
LYKNLKGIHIKTIEKGYLKGRFIPSKMNQPHTTTNQNVRIWEYLKITISLKFLLLYPNPKGDKRNFKLVSVQKWDAPKNFNILLKNSLFGLGKFSSRSSIS